TRSWAEAEKKADELKREHEEKQRAGDKTPPNPTQKPETMRQAVDRFLANKAQLGKSKAWNRMLRRDLDFAHVSFPTSIISAPPEFGRPSYTYRGRAAITMAASQCCPRFHPLL